MLESWFHQKQKRSLPLLGASAQVCCVVWMGLLQSSFLAEDVIGHPLIQTLEPVEGEVDHLAQRIIDHSADHGKRPEADPSGDARLVLTCERAMGPRRAMILRRVIVVVKMLTVDRTTARAEKLREQLLQSWMHLGVDGVPMLATEPRFAVSILIAEADEEEEPLSK